MIKKPHLVVACALAFGLTAEAQAPQLDQLVFEHSYEDEIDEDEPIEKYDDELTALTLAQQCVGEIDFHNPDECWVMWHINADLARRRASRDPSWHLVDQLRAYNSPFKVTTPRTLWVLELNLEGDQPAHWDVNGPSWVSRQPRWFAILELARKFLSEPGRKPCSANAYGGNCNNPKGACDAAPECWVQVVCHSGRQKPFAQAYYLAKRCVPKSIE